jgi:hypothetical protein
METVVIDPVQKWDEEDKVVKFVDSDESEEESSGSEKIKYAEKAPEMVYADHEDVVGGFNYMQTSILKADDPWLFKKTPIINKVTETKGEVEDRKNLESCYDKLNEMKVEINKKYQGLDRLRRPPVFFW